MDLQFFSVAVVSCSFGSSFGLILWYLLFILSVFWLLVSGGWSREFISVEKLAFLLITWLLVRTVFSENVIAGFQFVLSEYRTLRMAPFIGALLAHNLYFKQLWTPLIVGLLFNVLGSWTLTFASEFDFESALYVTQFLGLKSQTNLNTLNGKFTQAIVLIMAFGVISFFVLDKCRNVGLRLSLALILMFMFFHALLYGDVRSGILASLIGACGTLIYFFMARFCFLKGLAFAFATVVLFICALWVLMELSPRFSEAFAQGVSYFASGTSTTSVGARLLIWGKLRLLDSSELIFGVGSSGWKDILNLWFSPQDVGYYFVQWNDFHSQLIWLVVKGGLIAVAIYLWFCGSILLRTHQAIAGGEGYVYVGLGISLVTCLLFFGVFNSLLTSLRESHVFGLGLVVWLYGIKAGRE